MIFLVYFIVMIELKKTRDIDVFLIFRWLVLLSIILIAAFTVENVEQIDTIYKIAIAYFILNLILRIFKPDILKKQIALFILFFVDIIVVSIIFYFTEGVSSDFYIFYFLTIFMASISSGISSSLFITVASVGLYIWLVSQNEGISLENPVTLLKIVFLLLTAFISSIWNTIMQNKIKSVKKTEEKKKKELKKFYQNIINSINSGVAVFNNQSGEAEMELINPKAKKLVEENQHIVSVLKENAGKINLERDNHQLIKTDRGKYWGINWANLQGIEENEDGRVAIFNDITQRKKMEKEMERSRRINRLGKLTLQIAHDLKNPLGTVSGLAQMLKMKTEDEIGQKYAQKILKSTDKIDNLISDMMDFSREQEINKSQFDLKEFLEEIIEEEKDHFYKEEKNIEIKISSNKHKYLIEADHGKLWRVFNNLIKNAYEAIEDDGQITINLKEDSSNVIVEVEDNGMGIPESKLENIFEPFVTTKKNGTGLGLSIVQKIITSHQGKIFVDSVINEGTKFTVILPKKGGQNGKSSGSR